MYRPTPNFLMTIVLLVFLLVLLYVCQVIVEAAAQAALYRSGERVTPAPLQDWRPDIRHCHRPEVDLWDCIRNRTSASGTGSTTTTSD